MSFTTEEIKKRVSEINPRLWFTRFVFLAGIGVGEYYSITSVLLRELGCTLSEVFQCPPNPDFFRQAHFDPVCSPLSDGRLVRWNSKNGERTENVSTLMQQRQSSCDDWGSIVCVARDCGVWLNNNTIGSTDNYQLMDRVWLIFLPVAIGVAICATAYYLARNFNCFRQSICQDNENFPPSRHFSLLSD